MFVVRLFQLNMIKTYFGRLVPVCLPTWSQRSYYMKERKFHESQTSTFDEQLILVDDQDKQIGNLDKKTCHLNSYNQKGRPHRAFSLFLFNKANELLLHQRSKLKIVFPSAWTNSCCSHPLALKYEQNKFRSQPADKAVVRRTIFELGVDLTGQKLCLVDKILYKSQYDKVWGEHEVDYVYFCRLDQQMSIRPNINEISQHKWVKRDQLASFLKIIQARGGYISPWFQKIYKSQKLTKWWDTLIHKGTPPLQQINPTYVSNFK